MFARLREKLAHAFSLEAEPLEPEDERFAEELARRIAARKLTLPAVLAADAVRYTPGIHMLFYGAAPIAEHLAPFMSMGLVRSQEEFRRLLKISERREYMEVLVKKIEAAAA
jgi:hypothetical protein